MLHTRFCVVKTNDARFCKKRQKETPYRAKRYGVLWTRRESNPRPFGCEPNALPTELRAHKKAPNFEWGQMNYNTRSGMQRLHSQLNYRPLSDDPVSLPHFGKFVKRFKGELLQKKGRAFLLADPFSGCQAARRRRHLRRQR